MFTLEVCITCLLYTCQNIRKRVKVDYHKLSNTSSGYITNPDNFNSSNFKFSWSLQQSSITVLAVTTVGLN